MVIFFLMMSCFLGLVNVYCVCAQRTGQCREGCDDYFQYDVPYGLLLVIVVFHVVSPFLKNSQLNPFCFCVVKLNDNAKLKVVDSATIPTVPTSPNVTRNVLIGLIAGLVISIIISFVRDYFDVKIKYNEEMTSLGGYPVLAAIPDFEYFTNANKKGKSDKNRSKNPNEY